ncbi:extracellular solute-binding protein [Agrobacterium radiobacter]|uniref:ABC transporter periplasmic spermidine putrescine-binding protein potd n=1 Tax=Ochrobactrum sp. SJY1 TaxID=1526653 RepID=A0A075XAH0_9HYPH|nr:MULTISPECIES: extracellular solute-binding protein [Hyphomicrobiales]AIH15780.1 ABC transporter periplasmic spermidine putrescine-binding protein potd [Ochrobactrum sp. SJY1]ANH08429.1 putrescine/spermidine ABC transporter substrate-binding protein [Shinella sp. HZN7]
MITKTALIAALTTVLASEVAYADGELNIYTYGGYTSAEMIKKFESEYNVKVTISEYDTNDTALAKLKAGGHGFDLFVGASTYTPIFIREGLLFRSNPNEMANFRNVNKQWVDVPFDPGRAYTAPWLINVVGVSVNTSVYQGDINTAAIIFDPPNELKGKINVQPEMLDIMGLAIHYLGGKELCTDDKVLLMKVRDKLLEAKKHWISMDYMTREPMIKGDYAASADWNGVALQERLQNKDIAFGYPQTGFPYWMDNIGVVAGAPNLENAKLFINFIMDPQNIALESDFTNFANGIDGSDQFMKSGIASAPEFLIPDNLKGAGYWATTCPPAIQKLYGAIWSEVRM